MGNWFSDKFETSFPILIRNNYGWVRDLPDQRDQNIQIPNVSLLRRSVDLRDTNNLPPVYNQGEISSNVVNIICTVFEYEYKRQFNKDIKPSRRFLYYNQRVISNNLDDNGGSIRDAIKVINKLGVCEEKLCPYVKQQINVKPSIESYIDAQKYKGIKYKKIDQKLETIKCSLNLHYPVIFGYSIYESFDNEEGVETTGIMNTPKNIEKMIGGHVGLVCGYNDQTNLFLILNCWGEDWGDNGYFWMPYSYLISPNCSDFWIIEKIKKPDDHKTVADIVRGYQIREDEFSDNSDDEIGDDEIGNDEIGNDKIDFSDNENPIKKSKSKSSIIDV